jgi:hypothetical protein
MNLRVGAVLATLVAGPPLWILVRTGQLETDTALTRVLLVAVALAVGVGVIVRIAKGYQAQAEATAAVATAAEPAVSVSPGTVPKAS